MSSVAPKGLGSVPTAAKSKAGPLETQLHICGGSDANIMKHTVMMLN